MASVFLGLGCSAADPSNAADDGVESSAAALSDEPAARGAERTDTLLATFSDDTLRQFSLSGKELGIVARGLNSPTGLALDQRGNVYVANVADNTIVAFSAAGAALGVFASAGSGLNEPVDLIFDTRGDLLVSNIGDDSIRRFSATGQPLGVVLSLLGRGCPAGLAVSRTGHLFVADQCASVVRELSVTGVELGTFAASGVSNPGALSFNVAGDLLVANTAGPFGNTIHEFSARGRDLGPFATTGLNFPASLSFDRHGQLLVANGAQRPGAVDYAIHRFSPNGRDLGDFIVLPAQPRRVVVRSTIAASCN